ncbi:kama family protein [Mytilinidion resinicola]|uniref:Kama family protein n=1 Tax=Mytilinidion resinicola TaxID=574789 RepID=A0A6A6YLS3_9PEZI|nr:kama family protein [Mytilinidion resinicola]KAF2808934.1 kama family protein [Mytilinidion resinicola]
MLLASQPPPCSRQPYWQKIPFWRDVSEEQFLSYRWQVANTIQGTSKLAAFLSNVLPDNIPHALPSSSRLGHIKTRNTLIEDVLEGVTKAPMSLRVTPHIMSMIDWNNPLEDAICRQFFPLGSNILPDHPMLTLDSLHEEADSPVPGLVHRYPDKALFLATSVCPVYCRFCTRSYAVGANTDTVAKHSQKPSRKRWEAVFSYIEHTPNITDIVVSGGDAYYLQPEHIMEIGTRLLSIPHIRRIRFASKGLAVCPSRILDTTDTWAAALVALCSQGRQVGKHVALHTHFNHPNEITWVTELAAQCLFEKGVVVRNQTVLLCGVNDNVNTMSFLIRRLADMNIQPYYVYQGDMVRGVEDLRTPLQTILDLEQHIRGTIAGFMTPSFVVDLPGGGGKRLAASYQTYDRESGVSTFVAPSVKGGQKVYKYYDPIAGD